MVKRSILDRYKKPSVTVDLIVFTVHDDDLKVLLIERGNTPFKGSWAIPGGFVDYGESLESSAVREAKEETGLDIENLHQFHTYSQPGRDPRGHTISTVFIAKGKGIPKASDDAIDIGIFIKDNLPENLAFDHRQILEDYFKNRKIGTATIFDSQFKGVPKK